MNIRSLLLDASLSVFVGSILLVTVLMASTTGLAEDAAGSWTRFPGADKQGYVPEGQIPSAWSEQDYSWVHELGSRDVGSPIVVDAKVYYVVSNPAKKTIALESLDLATGKKRWSKSFPQVNHHLHKRNTFASSTPTADKDHVYVAWAEPEHTFLKCFDHKGNEIWSRDFGAWQSQHGFGTSPRIEGDLVLLLNSQQGEQLKEGKKPGRSRILAVDRKNGKTVWETPLKTTRVCYGVPAIYEANGKKQVVDANTGNGMFAVDHQTGKMLWNLNVFEMRCCSTPLIVGDLAIGSSGSGGGGNHLVAVRIPGSPNEKPEQVYRIDRGAPYVPTPVVLGDHLFMIDDKGIASCINVQTGEKIWMERVGGNFGASPIVIGDKMLVISLDGTATILRASDKFEKLGSFDLGGPVGASPAFAQGSLLLRIGDRICCLAGDAI